MKHKIGAFILVPLIVGLWLHVARSGATRSGAKQRLPNTVKSKDDYKDDKTRLHRLKK